MTVNIEREDIRTARGLMTSEIGGKREIARVGSHVGPDERVLRMAVGKYRQGLGLLVATDRRLLFVEEGSVNGQIEDFSYRNTSSIAWQSGLLSGTVVVAGGGVRTEIRSVDKRDGTALVDRARDVLTRLQQQPAAPPAPPSAGLTAQLAQAADLHRSGALDDAEFATLKARILAS